MAEQYNKKGKRKEYDGSWLTDTFNFKISPTDFQDEEETKRFLSHLYAQGNISSFLKSAIVTHFRREEEGYTHEEIEEALTFQRLLKNKGKEESFKKMLLFIELYGIDEIMEMIQNKGNIKEEEMAENIGKQVVEYLKQNLHLSGGIVIPPVENGIDHLNKVSSDTLEEEEKTSNDFTVIDFDDDDDE